MATFYADVANDGNKLATILGSQTSVVEEFCLQSGEVAVSITIDTVIKFDQEKCEEFFHTNPLSLSNKHKNTFRVVRNVTLSSSRKMTNLDIAKKVIH